MSMNHAVLMGTIIRGPEFRMTPNGVPNATFTIAVPRPPRGESQHEVTDYVRIVTWRAMAEKVNEGIQKGDLVTVEGRLTTRSWETQDGQRRKTVEVDASAVEKVVVGSSRPAAPDDESFEEPSFDEEPAVAPAARRPAPAKSAPPPADLDDEIPF